MGPPNPQRPAAQKQTINGTAAPPVSASNSGEPTVNRKKQKRRQKLAARLAAEQSADSQGQTLNGHGAYEQSAPKPRAGIIDDLDYEASDLEETYESREGQDRFYSEGGG